MTASQYETILYDVEDGIATITLNRPDRMNAMTSRMTQELLSAFDAVDADDGVRCVIFTGSGTKAFCAGADLGSGKTFDYEALADPDLEVTRVGDVYRDGAGLVTMRMYDCCKPIIAAVNGVGVGAGTTMQLAADIRIATKTARWGLVFARRGIVIDGAASWFLPRLVGMQTALDWCLSGRIFGADEALAQGLVKSLHEPDELLPAARAIAREIADNTAPVSVAINRQLLWRMAGADHPMEAHMTDSRAIQSRGASADAREGVSSFLEKRPPAFPNRVSTDMPDPWVNWRDRSFA
ncbi:crotonase/enoyl-CoA hydratase family protein [Novosphingobium sp. PASSN1]|uniref:crotonase/enoyl-CoA hydratase family protein n=1 Tax=Novosphingobium sp. PASSN1 TaxID=2015561 RepID=UPI000BD82460|nr:crotonase/enoyl-CoA hydratase family protein [Novosphingobium sp. PASSN1]OYU35722.1 MAG: enoyl-CoA hydratase [Novosphingobium sp. PASSN1]